MLLVATVIWGTAFVFQEEASDLGAFTLNGLRYILGGIILIPLILVLNWKKRNLENGTVIATPKTTLLAGVSCGVALAVAANLQQFGIMFNADLGSGDSGKAGFITAMYILFVPLFYCIKHKGLKLSVIVSVLLGMLGLYLISVKSGFSVATGDVFLLLCAIAFSAHILTVDHWVAKVDAVVMSSIQFLTVGVISLILSLIFERSSFSVACVQNALIPIIYLGIMSSGVAYTLQVLSQKHSEATVASLLMSLESLFALLAACVYYHKTPTLKEAFGCGVMLVAIFIIQTPFVDKFFEKLRSKAAAR